MPLGSFSRIGSEYLKCLLCFLNIRNHLVQKNTDQEQHLTSSYISAKYILNRIGIMGTEYLYYSSELIFAGFWLFSNIISILSAVTHYIYNLSKFFFTHFEGGLQKLTI